VKIGSIIKSNVQMGFKRFRFICPFSGPHTSLIIENNVSTSADVPGMANAYCARREKFGIA
jgi:hypothetical protein